MSDLTELNRQLENAKAVAGQKEKIERLMRNRDFKELIVDGFMRDEAARLVGLSADPNLEAKDQHDCLSMAQAGGHLKRYVNVMIQQGHTAEREIPNIEAALEEMRSEGEDD